MSATQFTMVNLTCWFQPKPHCQINHLNAYHSCLGPHMAHQIVPPHMVPSPYCLIPVDSMGTCPTPCRNTKASDNCLYREEMEKQHAVEKVRYYFHINTAIKYFMLFSSKFTKNSKSSTSEILENLFAWQSMYHAKISNYTT